MSSILIEQEFILTNPQTHSFMNTFSINLFDSHLIIQDGTNTILVDTGSPATIHTQNDFHFLGRDFTATTNMGGQTIESISQLLGMQITTLMGYDILRNYKLLIDYQNEQITFSETDIPFEGTALPLDNLAGIPIINLNIDNQNVRMFIDTGAKLSYISNAFTNSNTSIGTATDFHPMNGHYTTPVFEVATGIGEASFIVKYGNLPPALQPVLQHANTKGVIGSDLFYNFKVYLDYSRFELKFK